MTLRPAATLKRAHLTASCQDHLQGLQQPNTSSQINKVLHSSLLLVKDLIQFI